MRHQPAQPHQVADDFGNGAIVFLRDFLVDFYSGMQRPRQWRILDHRGSVGFGHLADLPGDSTWPSLTTWASSERSSSERNVTILRRYGSPPLAGDVESAFGDVLRDDLHATDLRVQAGGGDGERFEKVHGSSFRLRRSALADGEFKEL